MLLGGGAKRGSPVAAVAGYAIGNGMPWIPAALGMNSAGRGGGTPLSGSAGCIEGDIDPVLRRWWEGMPPLACACASASSRT